MKKIYDCFTFYNELDLLDVRLAELYNHVDYFVIVEANTTFTNRPKPFYFNENKERYSKYFDKIIHVKVEDMPNNDDPWVNEDFQRNQIMRGLTDATETDIIVVSDVDEIPRAAAIDHLRTSEQVLFAFRVPIYNFKFNYMKLNPDRYNIWIMATTYNLLSATSPNMLRGLRFGFFDKPYKFTNSGCEVIEHGGWHFGYLGDEQHLRDKAQSFSHAAEVNTPEFLGQIDVEASIAKRTSWKQDSDDRYEIVEVDNYLPKEIVNNQEKYQKYILDNPVAKTLDLLPSYPYNS